MDLGAIVAIDVHTHAERNTREPQDPVTGEILDAAAKYFGGHPPQPTAQEVADYYRERNMLAVVFTVDDEAGMGRKRLGNDEVLAAARDNADVLLPFGSVDPHKGKLGVREAGELIAEGVRGFKFHPNTQAFYPNDRAFYPLYAAIEEAGLIALFHSGTTGIGAGLPGGGGVRLKFSNPMYVDDVAADFPGLKIILAHPVVPVAGRGAGDRRPQAQRLHRPLGLVAEVLPGEPDPVHEQPAQAQDAVRLGLPADHAGPLAGGLRAAADQGRGATARAEGERGAAARPLSERRPRREASR